MTCTCIAIFARELLLHPLALVSVSQALLSYAIDRSHYHFWVIVEVRILLKIDYLSDELTLLEALFAVALVCRTRNACDLVGVVSDACA